MGIQIFGTGKCFDTKKAQRFFKERGVSVQYIDLREKEISRGELQSVLRAVGGLDRLLDEHAKDADTLALVRYLTADAQFEKVLENQQLLRTPIVRFGAKATVGYTPEVWKGWL